MSAPSAVNTSSAVDTPTPTAVVVPADVSSSTIVITVTQTAVISPYVSLEIFHQRCDLTFQCSERADPIHLYLPSRETRLSVPSPPYSVYCSSLPALSYIVAGADWRLTVTPATVATLRGIETRGLLSFVSSSRRHLHCQARSRQRQATLDPRR